MQQSHPHQWRRYGFGGPPEPWEHGATRNLDRLATSYYVDILESHRLILQKGPEPAVRARVDDLLATATRHKHEIDYTLAPLGHARRARPRRGPARVIDAGWAAPAGGARGPLGGAVVARSGA